MTPDIPTRWEIVARIAIPQAPEPQGDVRVLDVEGEMWRYDASSGEWMTGAYGGMKLPWDRLIACEAQEGRTLTVLRKVQPGDSPPPGGSGIARDAEADAKHLAAVAADLGSSLDELGRILAGITGTEAEDVIAAAKRVVAQRDEARQALSDRTKQLEALAASALADDEPTDDALAKEHAKSYHDGRRDGVLSILSELGMWQSRRIGEA